MNLVIQHHPDARCFLAQPQAGLQCRLDYERHGEQLIITHTGVPTQLSGQGLAGQLVEAAVRWLAPLSLQLVPGCSYVRHWLERHPRWNRLTTPAAAQRVLNEWFGVPGGPEDGQIQTKWFKKDAAYDQHLRERFIDMVEAALRGEWQSWDRSPWGTLARVLLLDQFTRNLFRDTARAFEGDALALEASLALVGADTAAAWAVQQVEDAAGQGAGQNAGFGAGRTAPQPIGLSAMTPLERWFVLMPLEHAESRAVQDLSVSCFEKLAREDARLNDALDYARKHRDVVQRFGRFPHRNAALGRASTEEEIAFLQQPGSRF